MPTTKRQREGQIPSDMPQRLADLYGKYIDRENDPSSLGSAQDQGTFRKEFDALMPPRYGYTRADFGTLQASPQYRGIRMVLPESGFSYADGVNSAGADLARRGYSRIMTEGPPGPPVEGDPHYNNIPQYPHNEPPDNNKLRDAFYAEMEKRGYPRFGGTGDLGGEFPPGFNPVGFGQRPGPATPTPTMADTHPKLHSMMQDADIRMFTPAMERQHTSMPEE